MSTEDAILTISVAAKLIGLHPRTLMLYEKAGLVAPYRTGSKRRLFSINDIGTLQFIKYLTRQKGVNLQGAKIIIEAVTLAEKEGIKAKRLLFPSYKPAKLV
jgi:MerR family transcriptional regulator, heat shock protein HspR